jgi:hypothetical protein
MSACNIFPYTSAVERSSVLVPDSLICDLDQGFLEDTYPDPETGF